VDGVGALETAPTSSSYEDDIRDVEQLARRLRPLWRDRAAKLDVAQKLRRFLHDHRGDRLGEALAVMAWRSKHRVSPDGDIPTESTLCRRVLDIGSSRANSLAHALVALDHAKVPTPKARRGHGKAHRQAAADSTGDDPIPVEVAVDRAFKGAHVNYRKQRAVLHKGLACVSYFLAKCATLEARPDGSQRRQSSA
jgi:hypothetical protein